MSNYGTEPCPICEHTPSVKWDVSPGGTFVRIVCKPIFDAKHMDVECGAASDTWALTKAVKVWNTKVARVKKALTDQVNK